MDYPKLYNEIFNNHFSKLSFSDAEYINIKIQNIDKRYIILRFKKRKTYFNQWG